jgi:hypothetical protein
VTSSRKKVAILHEPPSTWRSLGKTSRRQGVHQLLGRLHQMYHQQRSLAPSQRLRSTTVRYYFSLRCSMCISLFSFTVMNICWIPPRQTYGSKSRKGSAPEGDNLVSLSRLCLRLLPLLYYLHLPVAVSHRQSARSRVHPCRPNMLMRMVDFFPKPTDRPHLLALPRVRILPSSWHAAGLGSGSSLVMQTPSLRRIYANGAHL